MALFSFKLLIKYTSEATLSVYLHSYYINIYKILVKKNTTYISMLLNGINTRILITKRLSRTLKEKTAN